VSAGFVARARRDLTWIARETRRSRGRLAFFVACLAVGVAAVVSVASLGAGLDEAIRLRARELLAADLAVEGRRPVPDEIDAVLAEFPGHERTDVQEMVTLAAVPGRDDLCELKVVGGRYPYYGDIGLRPEPEGPRAERLAGLLDERHCVVGTDLLERLDLAVTDELLIGGKPFVIAAELLAEPDRLDFSMTLGPRVFLDFAGLERAGLDKRGSRIEHRVLIRLPELASAGAPAERARLDRLVARLESELPNAELFDIETWADAQPTLRRALRQIGSFLGLAALLSLWIGGIGVAQTVRAWLAARLDAIAIYKCLGLRPREIVGLFATQVLLLGLAGSLVGALGGIGFARWVPVLAGDLLPDGFVQPWQPRAIARGLGLGVGIALLFGLPPLFAVLRVPALRVLRRDVEPLPSLNRARRLTALGVLAGLFLTAWFQSGSLERGAAFTGGSLAVAGALYGAARGLVHLCGRLPRERLGFVLRYGIAALARPGAGTLGAIVALGFGVLAILAMHLVETRLRTELRTALPLDAPTTFLVDIQPEQWPGVRELLSEHDVQRLDSVPVVVARLAAVDGRSTDEIAAERIEGAEDERETRWILTREQRLTWLDELPEDNRVLRGELWADERAEVSIEEGYAEDLGVDVGSTLVFDVQGVPLELLITSVRAVDWRSFSINFFLVVEPGVLDRAPAMRVAAFQVDPAGERALQDRLAAEFGNVTLIPVRDVLETLSTLLGRLAGGVRLLGAFTVLAGIVILFGSVAASALRRNREAALFKALGLGRLATCGIFAIEHALVGLAAGGVGAAGACGLAWSVVTHGFELDFHFAPVPVALAIAGTVAGTIVAGLGAGLAALWRPPIVVLRDAA